MPGADGSIVIDTKILDGSFRKGIAGLKASAKVGALAITAAIGAAAVAFVSLAKEAEDAAVSDKRLQAIAKSMRIFGKESEKVTKHLIDQASALSLNIGVDDDSIKRTQAKLLTFKNLAKTADDANGRFARATKAAYDLQAAGFGEAEQNAVQLGKALEDPVKGITALARSGVTFTAAEKKKIKALVESGKIGEAQDLVLKAIEKQVGGTAEATVKASDKMQTAFGELKEAAGAVLLPAFTQIVDGITGLMNGEEGAGAKLAEGLANAGTAMAQGLTTVLPVLIQALVGIIVALAKALPALILATMPALIAGFKTLVEALPKILPALVEALAAVIMMLAEALPEILPLLVDAFMQLTTLLMEQFGLMAPELIPALVNALIKMALAVGKQAPAFLTAALVLIGGLATGLWKGLGILVKDWASNFMKKLEPIKAALPIWKSAGADLIRGLWDGISSMASWRLYDKIGGFVNGITNVVKDFFGIKSPSTLFEREVGVNLALGIGRGFSKSVRGVARDMAASVNAEMGRFTATVLPGGGSVAGSVDNSRVTHVTFAGQVRTYSETLRAMRDIEMGLAR